MASRGTAAVYANLRRVASIVAQVIAQGLEQSVPPPPTYPLDWPERRRRWWFATREALGLPIQYTRLLDPWSNQLETSWRVREVDSFTAECYTTVIYAPVVMGRYQYDWLRKIGWRKATEVIRDVPIRTVITAAMRGHGSLGPRLEFRFGSE